MLWGSQVFSTGNSWSYHKAGFASSHHACEVMHRGSTRCKAISEQRVAIIGASRGLGFEVQCLTDWYSTLGSAVVFVSSSKAIGTELALINALFCFQFVKQLISKKNSVHATVRHGGSDELLWLQKKNAELSLGHVDVSDPASIKVSIFQTKQSSPLLYGTEVQTLLFQHRVRPASVLRLGGHTGNGEGLSTLHCMPPSSCNSNRWPGQEWAQLLGKESEPLDYAIYVAGVVDDWADLEEVDESRMLHCFKVNTIGPLLTAQALVQQNLLAKGSVLAILTSKVTLLCFFCAKLLER